MGTAKSIWLITSGGVITAATTKAKRIAYLRLLRRPSELVKPAFVANNKNTGSSKQAPNAKISPIIKDKYSLTLGSNSTGRAPATADCSKLRKNSQATGTTT